MIAILEDRFTVHSCAQNHPVRVQEITWTPTLRRSWSWSWIRNHLELEFDLLYITVQLIRSFYTTWCQVQLFPVE